jgi:hypothetical protein
MSIRLGRSLCLLALGWIASACVSDVAPEAACESVGSPSVVVTVRDSTSGQAAADGAIGTLVGAGVDDTLTRTDSLTLIGGNQTGTYTVTIDRPGYLTWTAINIRVTEIGPCGQVIPVQLNARLQRETP